MKVSKKQMRKLRTSDDPIDHLMYHYNRVRQDMDTRRTRKNGWNDIVNAYMGKLPANWPFLAVVTDPRIRTTILEKTSRLLNAKLQGRLVPREGGDIIKAKINNAVLDFQWDNANTGGSMIEKVAYADQTCRLFGAAFAYVYWDTKRETNEIKVIDQRDIGFDGAATHIRNARWVQIREFTTWDVLEDRGYNVKKLRQQAQNGELSSQWRSSTYESVVKANKGLMDRTGEYDDPKNPILEVVTELTPEYRSVFLPRYGELLEDCVPNPYKHGQIPIAQLRYYPLGDDIYGESEVESVLPLSRAINAILCGFIDEMNISMRPPLKIASQGVRIETIQYGPGAQWIMQDPSKVMEAQIGSQVIANFNATYPALVAAYNTAMGDNSLGVSNVRGQFTDKTATEVKQLSQQQNNRDQYNQLYLAEFLKDIMMMWLSNNKQYLFDDPKKTHIIYKIIGKDQIQEFQQMKLDESDIPQDALNQIAQTVQSNPGAVSNDMLNQIVSDVSVPTNPVVTNPDEQDPTKMDIRKKLDVKPNGQEADLYVTPDDFDGDYDYIPDVTSMSSGALQSMKDARSQFIQTVLNPLTIQLLAQQGEQVKMKDLLISQGEDAGMKDVEALFQSVTNSQPQNGQPQPPGAPGLPTGQGPAGSNGAPSIQGPPSPLSSSALNSGIPGA